MNVREHLLTSSKSFVLRAYGETVPQILDKYNEELENKKLLKKVKELTQ